MAETTKKTHPCKGRCKNCKNKQKQQIPIGNIPIVQTN